MIERNGYEVISEEQYYRTIVDELKKEFPHMSESPSNLLTILARVIARNESMRDYDRVESYSNAYIATATGQHLSKAVMTAGIERLSGTKAVGKVLIKKNKSVPQSIVPKYTEISCDGTIFVTNNPNTLIINTDEYEIEVYSKDVGIEGNLSTGAKFQSVLNIIGIDSIVATTDIEGGTNEESDEELRRRYFFRMSAYSNSSLKGIIDAVLALPEVTLVTGDENTSNVEQDGLMPNSFIIYANGGSEQDVAEAIMQSKPAGIKTNGDIEKTVSVSGRAHSVRFSRFRNQVIYYNLEIVVDKSIANPNFVENVKNKIVEYTDENTMLVGYEISNFISKEMPEVRGVKSIKFGYTENPQYSDDIIASAGFNFFTTPEHINVVVI